MPGFFDATQVDPAGGTPSFPIGVHTVVIIASSKQGVKDKPSDGMLVFNMRIIEGENTGFVGAYRLNMWNSNQQSSQIAAQQLSALCHVTGRYQLATDQCTELFNIPFKIVVTQQPNNDKYTQISAVQDMAGNPPTKGSLPGAAAPGQQPQPAHAPQQPPPQQVPQPQQQTGGWTPGPQSPEPPPPAGPGSYGAAPASWQQGQQPQQPAQPPQQPQQQGQASWQQQPPGGGGQPSWQR